MSDQRARILIADDEKLMRKSLGTRLRAWNYEVFTAQDGEEAVQLAEAFKPDVVVSDIYMPKLGGLELMEKLKEGNPDLPVVLLTSRATVELAVEAMIKGAHNFLEKSADSRKLKSVLEAALREPKAYRGTAARLEEKEEAGLASASSSAAASAEQTKPSKPPLSLREDGFGEFIGTSKPMLEVYRLIQAVASKDVSVLITGESGTGKELVARTIHQLSPRKDGPFIAINTAAIPKDLLESEIFGHEKGAFTGAVDSREGCFERAHKGTLLLDELAEMPAELQPKLLRVLEDGRVHRLGGSREISCDVRVLAATNQKPQEAIKKSLLREDLYYRLNVFSIQLPPLRRRIEDLGQIIRHFTEYFKEKHNCQAVKLDPQAFERMKSYTWPGNIRELRNVLERAVILAQDEPIRVCHLPPEVINNEPAAAIEIDFPAGITLAEAERMLIETTLERVGNNKTEAARQLGLDPKTIRNKLHKWGIDLDKAGAE